MDDEKLRHWIEDKIVAGVSQDEIVMQTAERAGINWQEAELLVEDVFQQKQGHINRRQGPLMLLISLAVFAGGAFASTMLYQDIMAYVSSARQMGDLQAGASFLALFSDIPRLMFATAFTLATTAAGMGGVIKTIMGMVQE